MAKKAMATITVRLTLAELWEAWQAMDGIWEEMKNPACIAARDKISDAYAKLKTRRQLD
jgi:hypothetical protein